MEENQNPQLTPQQFAQKVKAKYPQYKDVDDVTLAKKMVEKYPEYAGQVNFNNVKKKESSEPTAQERPSVSPTKPLQPSTSSDTEKPTRAAASVSLGGPTDNLIKEISSIDKKLISKEEQDVVPLLTKKFSKHGFTFEETGAGDAMIVRNKNGETIEIDLDPWTTAGEEEGAIKLKKFLASSKSIESTEESAKLFSKQKRTAKEESRLKELSERSKILDGTFLEEFNQKNNKSNYVSKAKDELDGELNKVGFLNGIKEGLSSIYNTVVSGAGKLADLSEEEIKDIQVEKTPIAKEILEIKSNPKNAKLSSDEINKLAYEKAIENRADKFRESEINSFLSGLDDDSKQVLQADKILQQSTIEESVKLKQLEHGATLKSAEDSAKKYLQAVKQFGENSEEALSIKNDVSEKILKLKELEDSIYSDDAKIGSVEDELDLLRRNYGGFENFTGKWTSAAGMGFGGLLKAINQVGATNPYTKISNDLLINEMIDKSQNINNKLRRPISEVKNTSDFINYWLDTTATQGPNLVANAMMGYGSLPVLFGSTYGQKYRELEKEVQAGDAKYTPLQMIAVSSLNAGAEVISEIPTVGIIKKMSRVNKAIQADDIARRELYTSVFDRFKNFAGDKLKDQSKEIAGELFTNSIQNATDKYLLGKKDVGIFDNSLDIIKDTALLTSTLQASPHVFGAVIRPFTPPQYTTVLDKNSKDIAVLMDKINDPNISVEAKDLFKSKIDNLTKESGEIINDVISNIKGMPDNVKSEVANIEKKQSELRAKADLLLKDKTVDVATKKQLLDDLKSQFKDVENERIDILSGKKTVLTPTEVVEQPVQPEVKEVLEVETPQPEVAKADVRDFDLTLPDNKENIVVADSSNGFILIDSETKAPIEVLNENAGKENVGISKTYATKEEAQTRIEELKAEPEVKAEETKTKVEIPDWHREEYDKTLKQYEESINAAKKYLEEEKAKNFLLRSKSEIKFYEDRIKYYEDKAKLLQENPVEFYKQELNSFKEGHKERLLDKSTYKQDLIDRFGTTDFEVTYSDLIDKFNRTISDYEAVQKTANENAKLKKPTEAPIAVVTEAVETALNTPQSVLTTVTYKGTEYSKNDAGNWVNNKTGNEVKGIGPKGKALIATLNDMASTESTTQQQPAATEQVAKTEIEEALDDIVRPKTTNVIEQVDRAKKAISKILPGVEIIYHDTEESYSKATGEKTNGLYDPQTKKIHINGPRANKRTVAHEVAHAVILRGLSTDKEAAVLTKRMFKALRGSLKNDPKRLKELEEFAKSYEKGVRNEEKISELLGYLASEYETLPQPTKNIIQKWLEKIAIMLKMKPFTDKEVVDFMNTLAERVREGQEITDQDVKVISEKWKNISSPVSLIRNQRIGVFDVEYTEEDKLNELIKNKLVTEPDNVKFMEGKNVAITSPDDMLTGSISINGSKIFEGGGGVFFVTKYGDVWASGKIGTANTLANMINDSMDKNGGDSGFLVLTKGSDSKLISSSSGVLSSLSIIDSMLDSGLISLSDFRSAVSASVKKFGGNISLRNSAKQLKDDVQKYFSNPKESTFQKRGDVLKTILEQIAQSKSVKENKSKVIEFLGGDASKGLVSKVTSENKSRNQSLSDLVAGIASEKLTKGLTVGDVYAIIEVKSKVKVKEDSHPSYPFHIVTEDGSKPVLHLPKNRESGSEVMTTSSGKPYSVGNVSVMSGSFNAPGTRRQISPENSSNYANMTEDGKGNFVFYHYGPRAIKFVDPKRYGSNKGSITSKPEIAAMGRVGGMSQFYTTTEFSEANVVGDKYMIKVPMDKVYDFNTDPDNLIVKAKEMFKEKHPDLPFTANDQLAYITKLAEKAGYDMTVAEWNNRTRAQSTKPLKPVDVQTMDGNTIVKPFKEDYESNVSKGFTPVIPTSKEAMLKKVYDDINAERNKQNKYDDLYHLAEEFPKKTQEEITEMIEGSNISQELKDVYATALAYEPGVRMSARRQVNTGAIEENTKSEIDRVKKLPLDAEDGATFNLDGTKYDKGGLIVPVTSLEPNTNQKDLSSEMVAKFTKDNESKIGDDSIVKVGIYKFPDKDTVSVDMSIVIPNKYRAVALEFGKMIGQESLYDLDANENVKTGADGMNPVNLTDEQFRVAAAALKEGQMPQITISRRQQNSAIDTAVAAAKSRGFDDKTIINYLVSRGYTSEEATRAVLKYNKSVAEKIREEEGVFTRAGRRRIAIALDKFRRITVSKRAFNTKTGLQLREFMEGNINAELREARIALEEYDKMLPKDKAQRAVIEAEADKFLKGDTSANLPLEFKAVVGRFRTHIDNLSMRLIDTGTLTQAQADKLRSNIGKYVNRSYQVFDDPKWKDKVTEEMKEAVRNELRNLYYSLRGNVPKAKKDRKTYGDKFAYKVERALGKYGYDEDAVLNEMIEGEINKMIDPKKASGFIGQKNVASKDLSIMKQKNTAIPLSVRQLMGEYGNAGQNYAKTVQKLSALIYESEYLKNMRELGLGVFFFEKDDPNRDRKEFNTPIASEGSKVMSPLNGLYTTPEMAEMFKEDTVGDIRHIGNYFGRGFGPAIMRVFKMYFRLLGFIKKRKTAYSIGGHFKNTLGQLEYVLSNFYLNPGKYANAFMTLKNSKSGEFKKKMDEYIRLGVVSSNIETSEIKKLLNRDDFDSFLEKRLERNMLRKSVSWVDEKLTNLYQAEDDLFKIVSYEMEFDIYSKAYPNKSKEEIQRKASNNTKNIMANYNRIGQIGAVTRAAPLLTTFMSYQLESYRTAWNNIALAKEEMSSGNNVLRDAGRKRIIGTLSVQVAKHFIMHSLGTVVFSPILSIMAAAGADDEEEKEGITDYDKKVKYMNLMLPDYAKIENGENIVITREGGGEIRFINFSSSDPRKGISNTISAAIQGKDPVDGFIKGAEAIIKPFVSEDILKKALSEMSNNETDSGAKIYEESDSDYEKSLKLTNFAWKILQSGTYTSGEKILKSDDPKNEILGQLTGYKIHKIDVKKNLYFKLKELKKYEQSAMDKYGKANTDFENGKIDKEDRDKIQAQAQKSADKTYNEMREYLKAASYFGAKDYEIDEAFEKNGISSYVIKTLWANEMPVID